MLRIFTPVKIQRLRQTCVPEASMLTTRPLKPSAAYGTVTLYEVSWWPVGAQFE